MRLLGISAFYHDSAAALVVWRIVLPLEERFTAEIRGRLSPLRDRVLSRRGGRRLRDIDRGVLTSRSSSSSGWWKPIWPLRRALLVSQAMPVARRKFQRDGERGLRRIDDGFDDEKLLFTDHLSHVASALSLAVRGPGADHGWRRRVVHDCGGARQGQPGGHRQGEPLSPQPRSALLRLPYHAGFRVTRSIS